MTPLSLGQLKFMIILLQEGKTFFESYLAALNTSNTIIENWIIRMIIDKIIMIISGISSTPSEKP